MKVADLKPYAKKIEVIVKVLNRNDEREVTSKLDDSTHRVTEVLIGDDSGTVFLTLWDDTIEKFEVGKSYIINNGYISMFRSSLRLNIGRYGEFKEAETAVEKVDESNNLSEKEFEN